MREMLNDETPMLEMPMREIEVPAWLAKAVASRTVAGSIRLRPIVRFAIPDEGVRRIGPLSFPAGRLRRIRRLTFPVDELVAEEEPIAHLGRDSSLWILFGRGRRVELADGTTWRIKAANAGPHVVPVVWSDEGTLAISGQLHAKRSYGITGKHYAYTLVPLTPVGLHGPRLWALRQDGTEIAVVEARERVIRAVEPIPIAAALLVFTLIAHGIPGEGSLMPKRDQG